MFSGSPQPAIDLLASQFDVRLWDSAEERVPRDVLLRDVLLRDVLLRDVLLREAAEADGVLAAHARSTCACFITTASAPHSSKPPSAPSRANSTRCYTSPTTSS
ncbi:MAG: hypothetical protein NTZ50_15305 [Chloroflexi bacterium]|nr:hypothetical protein [Chloroflexota bacterium]